MKRIPTLIAALAISTAMQAQVDSTDIQPFSKLDGGMTFGTTGIGFEVTTPLGRNLDIRAGFDFMPHFKYDMSFGVTVGDASQNEDKKISKTRFQKMADTFHDMTGYTIDDKVVMEGVPKYYNFRLLVDFKPFNNKRWYVTAGFYWGNSKIADAENSKEDMTSLFAVGLYNQMYERAINSEPLITYNDVALYLPYAVEDKLKEYGRMSIHVGTYKRDITDADGNVIHKKGEEYYMEPNANSLVRVTAKANRFKPYLGFGYMGAMSKKDPRWHIGFDAGAMFWGGSPELKTHDGTDLINDVHVTRRKVRHYVKLFKLAKVMPAINLRITRTITGKP